jgi:heterotetrameric sarcosine oxidase delta subunit
MRITCPFCGERDHSEFTYGGDASIVYPALSAPAAEWFEAVYLRDNPKGPHLERWHHVEGCRLWLVIERDTATHEITSVAPARNDLRSLLKDEAR